MTRKKAEAKAEELATEFHGKKTLHSIWVDE